PLEAGPHWAYAVGLPKDQAHFQDVFGLDDELLDMVPEGVKAVALLFPCVGIISDKRTKEDAKIKNSRQEPINPGVFWMKQTISNACGTMGLIHSLANTDVSFTPGSPLAKFIEECRGKTPQERAKLLETTPLFEQIHESAASSCQSGVPQDLNTDLHFTCFVKAPATEPDNDPTPRWRLIELDGGRIGPIDRGKCDDLLKA
ncbi:peptidase C12, ubiquitin carboxyl-terminal hydrolase, partial [Boletus coccyginus]